MESVRVPQGARAIDLTHAVEQHTSEGDRLQVSTAPGPDGIVRRIEVGAREAGCGGVVLGRALLEGTLDLAEALQC